MPYKIGASTANLDITCSIHIQNSCYIYFQCNIVFYFWFILYYFLFFELCHIIISLVFWYSVCNTRNVLQTHGKYSYCQNILTYWHKKSNFLFLQLILTLVTKAKRQFNKFRFASIQLMRFSDMLKVVNDMRGFARMFSIYCFDFGH